ncbi:HD-GYP domain-containing protein [Enterovirga sp. DB1703]|uniref:HD-GYP domain-containing protein n=2 Tax=Enterovirga aerilata TaxID=2730920 RepID=A0A849IBC0_9HYPH|nr:HD-GYP domain-containing protein [Enterovirga sp. DB1703]
MPAPGAVKLSEILSAFSFALDMTEGQPDGHCVRCCWIGMHIGRELALSHAQLWELYYALLLKDLGGSSNAARICELFLTDDLRFKRDFKRVGDGLSEVVRFILSHTGQKTNLSARFRAILNVVRNSSKIARELTATRCQRGAEIARRLRFSDRVAEGIACLDEHWAGSGRPRGLAGEALPIYSRIALLAQVVDVFQMAGGREAARAEVAARAGTWFDPTVVAAFEQVAAGRAFWSGLASPDLARAIFELEPAQHSRPVEEDYLDDIAEAFAQVVDTKSPFTSGHSTRVAFFVDLTAAELGFAPERRRWLRRGALLHDLGKLGVSNSILDKPGRLDEAEWEIMRQHPAQTARILSRIEAFRDLARMAGAHHERLDGKGYPDGLTADRIPLDTRVITVADVFDALTSDRPHRSGMTPGEAFRVLDSEVGTTVDGECLAGLKKALDGLGRAIPQAQAAA